MLYSSQLAIDEGMMSVQTYQQTLDTGSPTCLVATSPQGRRLADAVVNVL